MKLVKTVYFDMVHKKYAYFLLEYTKNNIKIFANNRYLGYNAEYEPCKGTTKQYTCDKEYGGEFAWNGMQDFYL